MTGPGLAIERATWLPARTERIGDWLLGFTGGLTKRANSAVPATPGAALSDADLARIEARYAAAGQPAVFRICSAAPAGLDHRLADRGYAEASVTEVWARELNGTEPADTGSPGVDAPSTGAPGAALVAPRPTPAGPVIVDADRPDDDWLDGWLGVKQSGARPDTAERELATGLLTGSPARYLSARTPDGIALGVLRVATAGEWAGLSCLAVTPAARRRGTGRALTLAGLHAAAAHGAERAFLQVEVHNTPAQRLYRDLGFTPVERYVYRER